MKLTAMGNEMKIGSGAFERSSVAWTQDGRLVVAADMGEKPVLWFGEEPVRGSTFTMKPLVDGLAKDPIYANRCFLPMVVVDADGAVWVSFKTGTKELDKAGAQGTTRGAGLAAVIDGNEPEVVLALADVGHAQAQPAPGKAGVVVLGTLGKFAQFDAGLNKVGSGTFSQAGDSGEKIQFRIGYKKATGVTVWHTCHNGFSKQSSRYACTGMGGAPWADFKAYPQQGDDTNHPGLGVDAKRPGWAVMGAVLDVDRSTKTGHVRYNTAKNGVLERDPASLPILGDATLEVRFGPQFVPHPKGGWIGLWNLKGKVRARVVDVDEPAQDVVDGRFASGAMRKDVLAVVYARAGALWKREFRVTI